MATARLSYAPCPEHGAEARFYRYGGFYVYPCCERRP